MEQKFREITGNSDDIVINMHQHIDNGGYGISGDKFGSLSIDFSFFGYATTSITLPFIDLDGLIDSLQEYKRRLNELETVRILKGE